MNSKVAWVLVSSRSQVQRQIILNPDYLPDYLSVSYDYAHMLPLKFEGHGILYYLFSGSIEKLFSIDCVNIYVSKYFFQ